LYCDDFWAIFEQMGIIQASPTNLSEKCWNSFHVCNSVAQLCFNEQSDTVDLEASSNDEEEQEGNQAFMEADVNIVSVPGNSILRIYCWKKLQQGPLYNHHIIYGAIETTMIKMTNKYSFTSPLNLNSYG
jgi:hypothetical protein